MHCLFLAATTKTFRPEPGHAFFQTPPLKHHNACGEAAHQLTTGITSIARFSKSSSIISCKWCEVRRQVPSVPSDARLQPLKHVNKPITWLVSVVIVMSMPGVGPLQVPPPVGGGEAHAVGPGAPTCVDREVFSSNEFFSITTSRSISNTTSFLLSPFLLRSPFLLLDLGRSRKGFSKKKKISGEVNRDKTDRRSLVSSRRTQ